MNRLVVVDDEPITAKWIASIIDNTEFELAGVASDGIDAIELIRRVKPDIIMTDIKMPRMDGLSLIRELKREGDAARIIILSSYSDFRFTSEAIRLGADDYLLKSEISESELLDALRRHNRGSDRITTAIGQKMVADDTNSIDEDRLQSGFDEFIRSLQSTKPTRPADDGFRYGLILSDTDIRSYLDFFASSFAIYGISSQYSSTWDGGGFFVALKSDSQFPVKDLLSSLYGAIRAIPADEGSGIMLGGTLLVPGEKRIDDAADRCLESLQSIKFYSDQSGYRDPKILLYEDLEGNLKYVADQISNILRSFELGRRGDFEQGIFGLLERVGEGNYIRPAVLVDYAASILLRIDLEKPVLDSLAKLATFSELAEFLGGTIKHYRERVSAKERSSGDMVERARRYIMKHYTDSQLSLDSVSEHVDLTRSYFSDQFHKRTGQTFQNYLSQLRIERAEYLLTNTEMKVNEISQVVGFANTSSFIRFFRRLRNCSPAAYRQNNAANR